MTYPYSGYQPSTTSYGPSGAPPYASSSGYGQMGPSYGYSAPLAPGYQPPPDRRQMEIQLNAYYAGACSDGVIDTNEVMNAVKLFGITIDITTARSLLQQIAGPARHINQAGFTNTIIDFVLSRRPPPCYYSSQSYGSPAPPYSSPTYGSPSYGAPPPPPPGYGGFAPPPPAPPPAPIPTSLPPGYSPPPGAITAGPSATYPNAQVASGLTKFYAEAAADGTIDGNEVIKACRMFGVGCDMAGASQLLAIVAAPEGRITQSKFVHHIGVYITRNLKY
ncbi:uncharacterized protein MONOS_669 [Monocercomonoides exilis]|uniref:uncharacterized protein n=1 Tax=Monocercomonoides exilis TaxID=2049356 RepID=UPI00355ACD61|nr:hypothetical protein MONOS_669 [Monocercomonoides exilis]|eukprot:MONOS_669.1-p1 / transcript=MONOS_669.1 / gene=MONOS_669 / organism=Monocercomonoides_exilis_PA203 / gene_product=unspecified product / transcript_product=unspecified product / location=Mono_scaffold00011:105840-106670(-) / protein_length=277 / sequence_SO=supercontig / SO=protein_coding / is_pseudo=false